MGWVMKRHWGRLEGEERVGKGVREGVRRGIGGGLERDWREGLEGVKVISKEEGWGLGVIEDEERVQSFNSCGVEGA